MNEKQQRSTCGQRHLGKAAPAKAIGHPRPGSRVRDPWDTGGRGLEGHRTDPARAPASLRPNATVCLGLFVYLIAVLSVSQGTEIQVPVTERPAPSLTEPGPAQAALEATVTGLGDLGTKHCKGHESATNTGETGGVRAKSWAGGQLPERL